MREGLRLRDLFECLASRAYPYADIGELAALPTPEAKFCSEERSDHNPIRTRGLVKDPSDVQNSGLQPGKTQGYRLYLLSVRKATLVRAGGALVAALRGARDDGLWGRHHSPLTSPGRQAFSAFS
jgi:hypothetical protein